MRRLRTARRWLAELSRENQWLLPLSGAVVGTVLALLVGDAGEDAADWAVTIDRARDTLMGWLSIVFAGFAIVLAVGSLTIQNVVGRFGLRMYRIYQRDLRDRFVIAVFALTSTYIVTEQVLLRGHQPDDPVPVVGFTVGIGLLLLSGLALLWYITTVVEWFRVDFTAKRVARLVLTAARGAAAQRSGSVPVSSEQLARPDDAHVVPAPRSGFLESPDNEVLMEQATRQGWRLAFLHEPGDTISKGDPIGWLAGHLPTMESVEHDALGRLTVSDSRSMRDSPAYGIAVLVDVAIMALSPAVNDPHTAVEVVERLHILLPELADFEMGPYGFKDGEDNLRLVRHQKTFGDHVRAATEQILLYGHTDPAVLRVMDRLTNTLERLDLQPGDAAAVGELRASLDSHRAEWESTRPD